MLSRWGLECRPVPEDGPDRSRESRAEEATADERNKQSRTRGPRQSSCPSTRSYVEVFRRNSLPSSRRSRTRSLSLFLHLGTGNTARSRLEHHHGVPVRSCRTRRIHPCPRIHQIAIRRRNRGARASFAILKSGQVIWISLRPLTVVSARPMFIGRSHLSRPLLRPMTSCVSTLGSTLLPAQLLLVSLRTSKGPTPGWWFD